VQRELGWSQNDPKRNQSLTVNTSVRYMYFFCNTLEDGPVVVDLPPAVTGASFYGTIVDAWQVPLVDIGFEGKGGKYLVLPPDYKADVPAGYIPVRPTTITRTRCCAPSWRPPPKRMSARVTRW
jgi:hypothetical protein